MKRLVQEPLVHFMILGAALFGVYALVNRSDAPVRLDDVVVTAAQIEFLEAGFAKAWQRPPTEAELKGLIDQYVKEEILSREAIRLGLDQNDTIIRRRLQQKMEFFTDDLATTAEPTDAELADYLAHHPDEFAQEQRFTFRHVYLSPDKHGDRLDAHAAALLADLRTRGASVDTSELGDRLMLPSDFIDEPQRSVASLFGESFATDLARCKTGEWSGPIRSGYGIHLIQITARTEGRIPPLADVRDHVKRELLHTRRQQASQKLLETLLEKYQVRIEWPKDGSTPPVIGRNERQ